MARRREAPSEDDELFAVLQAAERFVRAIEARSMALMLKLDLTMPQLRTLLTIRRLGRAHGRQLAAALNVTPGAIVAMCDHLERHGYLRRVTDTSDRRITWFEVTERGRAGLRAMPTADIARSRMKTLIGSLSSTEREGFIKVADAFADAVAMALEARASARDGESAASTP